VLILPFIKLAVGMASYLQKFAKHNKQISIFRTGAQKNISNKGAFLTMFFCMVFNDGSSSPINCGVGIPNVMLYPTNPSIIAGHVATVPSSDTNLIFDYHRP
jgi:hypothetical protein